MPALSRRVYLERRRTVRALSESRSRNSCELCGTDVVIDGNTFPFNTHVFDANQSGPGDMLPNVLIVEVRIRLRCSCAGPTSST